MFTFVKNVEVPPVIIEEIINTFKHKVFNTLTSCGDFDGMVIMEIDNIMSDCATEIISGNVWMEGEGWTIDKDSVCIISDYINRGQRVEAIKEFRRVTGCGLREGRNFITKFKTGMFGAEKFKLTFMEVKK